MQRRAAKKKPKPRWVLTIDRDIDARMRAIANREERSLSWVTRAVLRRGLEQVEAEAEAEVQKVEG